MLLALWIGLVILIYIFAVVYKNAADAREGFADGATLEDDIVTVYMHVLDRQPKAEELIADSRAIKAGELTLDGLYMRLINSDEYARKIKVQSNLLAPELDKMLSQQRLLQKVQLIYREERNHEIPPNMVLPYRDLYIKLDYNEYAFRAMLRNKNVDKFEQDISRIDGATAEDIAAVFDKYYKVDALVAEGAKLQPAGGVPTGLPSSSTPVQRSIFDKDTDSQAIIDGILEDAKNVYDCDAAAKALTATSEFDYLRMPVTHEGDMVLRPEFAWSVPQTRPPVCTSLGQPSIVQPVFLNQDGADVDEAATQTAVGSLMPKFTYREYVDVRVPKAAAA